MSDDGGRQRWFAPKGDEPEWKILYTTLLETADFGDVITYAALDEALGRTFCENRSPLYRARRELGDSRKRWLEAIPGKGYRVIEANEHLSVAGKHKRRAKRQLQLAVHVGAVTDLTRLEPTELERWQEQTNINRVLLGLAMHHEQRLRRIEDVLRQAGLG